MNNTASYGESGCEVDDGLKPSPSICSGQNLSEAVAPPEECDVICASASKSHPGTIKFRRVALAHREEYRQAQPAERTQIVAEIVDAIRNGANPSRFLRKDWKTNLWFEVSEESARAKVETLLRNSESREPWAWGDDRGQRPTRPPTRFMFSDYTKPGSRQGFSRPRKMAPKEQQKEDTTVPAAGNAFHPSLINLTMTLSAPKKYDIICGRTSIPVAKHATWSHPGNIACYRMVLARLDDFRKARGFCDKAEIVSRIFDALRSGSNPSRFLRKDGTSNYWLEVSDDDARELIRVRLILEKSRYRKSSLKAKLMAIDSPGENDVICGMNRIAKNTKVCCDGTVRFHPGNLMFHRMVQARLEDYNQAKRLQDRTRIIFEIIRELRHGGKSSRFLQRDDKTNLWFCIDGLNARERVEYYFYMCLLKPAARRDRYHVHRIVLDELEDDFDEMPILQTPISSMPPPLNPRAQTMNRASDIATSITIPSYATQNLTSVPAVSPESSEGASLLADEDDVGRPHIEELPRIEEKMFARGNNWNESLNQYYCDIIDMEQHFILFDRLSRKERWYILKHFLSSYPHKDKDYGRLYVRTRLCALLVDACSEPGYCETSLVAWSAKDWHDFMEDLDRTKVVCLRPDCHHVFGLGPDQERQSEQNAEERAQLTAFTSKFTVLQKACQICFHLSPIRFVLEQQIAAGDTGQPKSIPPEFVKLLFATAQNSDSSVIRRNLLRLFISDPVPAGNQSATLEAINPQPILRNLEELKEILCAKPFSLLWFQSRLEQLVWMWNEACFGSRQPYLQLISYRENGRRNPNTPLSRRRVDRRLSTAMPMPGKSEGTLATLKRFRKSPNDEDDSSTGRECTRMTKVSKVVVTYKNSDDEAEEVELAYCTPACDTDDVGKKDMASSPLIVRHPTLSMPHCPVTLLTPPMIGIEDSEAEVEDSMESADSGAICNKEADDFEEETATLQPTNRLPGLSECRHNDEDVTKTMDGGGMTSDAEEEDSEGETALFRQPILSEGRHPETASFEDSDDSLEDVANPLDDGPVIDTEDDESEEVAVPSQLPLRLPAFSEGRDPDALGVRDFVEIDDMMEPVDGGSIYDAEEEDFDSSNTEEEDEEETAPPQLPVHRIQLAEQRHLHGRAGNFTTIFGTKIYTGPPPDEGVFDSMGNVLRRHPWTPEEVAALISGYEKYGMGKWARIKQEHGYVLRNRTSVQIKDKFRTMQRRGELPCAV